MSKLNNLKLFYCTLALVFNLIFSLGHTFKDSTIAIVNKSAITSFEIMQVKKLAALFSGSSKITPDMDQMITNYALTNLITQKLMLEQKQFSTLRGNENEINDAIKNIESNLKLPSGYLKKITLEKGIYNYFRNKVELDLLVDNITKQVLMPSINVFDDEVEELIALGGGAKINVCLKIFTSDKLDDETYKQMQLLRKKIVNKNEDPDEKLYKSFATLEHIKSDIENLTDSLKPIAKGLKSNQVSTVFKTFDGFKILVMQERVIVDLSEEDRIALVNSIASNKMNIAMKKLDSLIQRKAYIKILN